MSKSVVFALGLSIGMTAVGLFVEFSEKYKQRIDGALKGMELKNIQREMGHRSPEFDSAWVEFAEFIGQPDWRPSR